MSTSSRRSESAPQRSLTASQSGHGVAQLQMSGTGHVLVGGVCTGTHLDPPFTRHTIKGGRVADSGRYGHWSIGHGGGTGHWDRSSTPSTGRSDRSSRLGMSTAQQELRSTNLMTLQKALPGGVPFETSFSRVMARAEPPKMTANVAHRSPLVCTQAGIVGR
eukprot:TRINITY_DN23489_c0_g1_i1.p1 TRINITY_DN23489_c0_g1~~TRINITY_DN23489_c0_g1_i1.p1  ORF type:complete len:173 (-),score=12.37 TRINITY_DN23489_c0_g1_i1:120-605(-)